MTRGKKLYGAALNTWEKREKKDQHPLINYLITYVTCSCFAAFFFYVKAVHTHKYAQRENCAANYFSQRAWPY